MATINEIKQQAAAVKNATQVGENTAERVGGALAGLADIAEQQDTKLSDLSSSTDRKSDTYLLGTHPELFGKYTMIGSNNSILVLNKDPHLTWSCRASSTFIDLSALGFSPKTITIYSPSYLSTIVMNVVFLQNKDIIKGNINISDAGLIQACSNENFNNYYDKDTNTFTITSDNVDMAKYKYLLYSFLLTDRTYIVIDGDSTHRAIFGIENEKLNNTEQKIDNEISALNRKTASLDEQQRFSDTCLSQLYVTEADFNSYEKIVDKLEIYHLGIPNLSNMNYTYDVEEPWEGFKPRTYKFKDTSDVTAKNRYTSFLIHADPSSLNGDFCNARVWDANGNFIWSAKLANGNWQISLPYGYEIEIYQNIGIAETFWVRMKQGFFDESERGNVENNLNPWAGKCIAFYGDSVTYIGQGTGTSMGHASSPYVADWGNNWQLYIAKYLGLKEFYSRGVGSAMYEYQNWVQYAHTETGYSGDRPYPFVSFDEAEEKEGFTKTHGYLAAWDRIKAQFPASIKDTIDAIFIMDSNSASNHTTDDFQTPAFIEGATKDSDWAADNTYNVFGGDYDITTFAGAICSMIMKLQAWMPNAQIIIGSQISGRGDDSISGAARGENFTKLDEARRGMYCAEKTRKIAGMMSIPYIPVWETMSVNPLNRKGKISDIVHPYTKAGGYRVGKTIAQYLMNFTPSEPPV